MTEESRPVSVVTSKEVADLLRPLEFGWYSTTDLYERYAKPCRARGAEPAHPIALGRALSKAGAVRRRRKEKGKTIYGWLIGDGFMTIGRED